MSIAIQHKEPRYFFFGFLPIALWAGLGAETIIKIVVVNSRGRAVAAGLLVAVPALLGYRMPTPVEPDYGPVIAAHAAQMRGKIVLFEGHRDGDFVFAARERLGWRGCVIIRGSKVFYSCASDPRFDFTSYVSSREDIRAIIHSFGFETLFVERGNAWKLREVEWLQEELNDSGRYLLTRSHELKSTRSDGTERIRTVDVYLPKNPTRRQMRFVNIPVPIAGGSIRIDLAAAVEP